MQKIAINGRKSIEELINDKTLRHLIENIYLSSTQKYLIDLCEQKNISFEIKSKHWFDRLKVQQKYKYATAFLYEKKSLTLNELIKKVEHKEKSLIVFLDKIHDPYNFGTILRTCAAAGVDGVIYSKHEHAPLNSTVLKASQGYALKTNLVVVSNLNQALDVLKKYGFWSYSTNLDENAKNYSSVKLDNKSILIFGNEGNGVSELLNKSADYQLYVPMNPEVNSLNVSVCAGIFIFKYLSDILG